VPPRNQVDKKRIIQLADAGTKPAAIAQRLGVSEGAVYRELQLRKARKR
jgi:hypothetical protein